jgi:hypothetical protein
MTNNAPKSLILGPPAARRKSRDGTRDVFATGDEAAPAAPRSARFRVVFHGTSKKRTKQLSVDCG